MHQPEFYQDNQGEWRWRVIADNGEIVFASSEGYTRKAAAESNAALMSLPSDEMLAEPNLPLELPEQRGVTWDLEGWRLYPFQQAQFLYGAGLTDASELATMIAVLHAESGAYLLAWHHNVEEMGEDEMTVKSTDLGWMQRNVVHSPPVTIPKSGGRQLAHDLFVAYPNLGKARPSATLAKQFYDNYSFSRWYAWLNGSWENHRGHAVLAVGNFLAVKLGLGQSYLEVRD